MSDAVSEHIIRDIAELKGNVTNWDKLQVSNQKYLDEKFTNLEKSIENMIVRFGEENKTILITIEKMKQDKEIIMNKLSSLENEIENGRVRKAILLTTANVVFTFIVTIINIYLNLKK